MALPDDARDQHHALALSRSRRDPWLRAVQEGPPVCYTEDVGRHNAVDKIAGWIYRHSVDPADKIMYTTGRLTSEMVIKTVRMGIPILVSRSGFTAWGVELARQVGLTLVGRARGKRFIALSGQERIVFDQRPRLLSRKRSARHKRKGEAAMTRGGPEPTAAEIPGVLLAGGLARRMGGGDKPLRTIGGRTILDARDRAACAAMRRPHPQRQWRSRALRRLRAAA